MTQQPGWGPQQPQQQPYHPQQPGPYGPPPPPQKKGIGVGGGIAIGCGGLLAVVVLIGVIGALGSSDDTDSKTGAKPAQSSAPAQPAAKPKTEAPAAEAPKDLSKADQFKAFVAKNGTEAEQAAVKHVTKVQGADEQNDILDTADVYTDFKGGFMSKDASKAKLIASAFADWKHSKNGLVTIYGSDGDLITNGKY